MTKHCSNLVNNHSSRQSSLTRARWHICSPLFELCPPAWSSSAAPPETRLVPSVLAVPCWVWMQNELPGYQTPSLHRPPRRWELATSRRPSSPKGTANPVKPKWTLKGRWVDEGSLMPQHLARGALQAGGVVAGGGQGADAHLQATDHLVAAGQLRAQILHQTVEVSRLASAVTRAPATTIGLVVPLKGQRRAHLQIIKVCSRGRGGRQGDGASQQTAMKRRHLVRVAYQGCWCLLSLLHSHCGRRSHNPGPGDPPAPVYWPAGRRSQLHREEKNT